MNRRLKRAGRDAAVEVFAFGLFRLVALDRHDVLLGCNRDFVRREASHRQRNLISVVAKSFDVVGRVVVLGCALGGFREVEKAVETDGRTPERREVISAHSQILQRAKWLRAAPDTTGARFPPAHLAPGRHPAVAIEKL